MKTCKRKKSYPVWAKYKARDESGVVLVFENKPRRWASVFIENGGASTVVSSQVGKIYKCHWTKSLREIEG